ncbi:MAG TPA: ferritin-like protein [Bradyrhizobium sp.]|nr:ferritin-like protein [Bradyrhizobium sp.]
MAIELEFSTLPPYLYALYSIKPGTNAEASSRIRFVAMQEMVHLCLACNILNALGKNPVLTAPTYPGPLPGGISGGGKQPLIIHLYPFSSESMSQAMAIEEPEGGPIDFPHELVAAAEPTFMTIGQFYNHLDSFLETLPASQWKAGRNQIDDHQFLQGEIFAVNNYADAHLAIQRIVSEGEGTRESPLDFAGEVSHYYRFAEIFYDQVLTKADNPKGYVWKGTLGVDWKAVYPAISDPGSHDFSKDPPAARNAQDRCDEAYTRLVQELQRAVTGEGGRLGNAVQAMFDLRMAAKHALTVPLAVSTEVAGPSFRYRPGIKAENLQ